MESVVRPGQVWGDANDIRELIIKHVDERYAYCIDTNGRRTRILLRRMKPRRGGFYLKVESPARYIEVPSEEGVCVCNDLLEDHGDLGCLRCAERFPLGGCVAFQARGMYKVWTGDLLSPPHCPCEDFRQRKREPGVSYLCKHLKLVLQKEGMV